jgi:UDP-glucuronate 4-epimerase
MNKNILITGSAGFIGFHLTKLLLSKGHNVFGIDNLNQYYDPKHKNLRQEDLRSFITASNLSSCFQFKKIDLCDKRKLDSLFQENKFDIIINLAAQAGVRYSIENPSAYIDSNIVGFVNLLEACRSQDIKHFIFASSSSVYGLNTKQPFATNDITDYPISLYAATKKSNEVIAHAYSHLFSIPTTGLRFFTVYGTHGRPDMAYFKFTEAIHRGDVIDVYNSGIMKRDFTYIDDITLAIDALLEKPPERLSINTTQSNAKYKIYNLGNNHPITLRRFIGAIEQALHQKALEKHLPMQPGDVLETFADIDDLSAHIGFKPETTIEKGIQIFVDWYKKNNISI